MRLNTVLPLAEIRCASMETHVPSELRSGSARHTGPTMECKCMPNLGSEVTHDVWDKLNVHFCIKGATVQLAELKTTFKRVLLLHRPEAEGNTTASISATGSGKLIALVDCTVFQGIKARTLRLYPYRFPLTYSSYGPYTTSRILKKGPPPPPKTQGSQLTTFRIQGKIS